MARTEDTERKFSSGLIISDQFTLPELVDHMRQGQTVLGSRVKPYPWLEYTTRSKSETELKMEAALTSCTFKTITSCVIGRDCNLLALSYI